MHHVLHNNESCHGINATCHVYESVMSHTSMHHVLHNNESCYGINATCHVHGRVMSHT